MFEYIILVQLSKDQKKHFPRAGNVFVQTVLNLYITILYYIILLLRLARSKHINGLKMQKRSDLKQGDVFI